MSINLNSRNNTLCCKVNDLYTALMASELLNDCVDDVVVMLKTCVDYVNIVSSQEVQIQHARFTMDGEEFRQYVMELDRHRRALHEGLMARVNFANRLCVKMNTPVLAERVTEEDRETYFAFAKEVVDSYFGEAILNEDGSLFQDGVHDTHEEILLLTLFFEHEFNDMDIRCARVSYTSSDAEIKACFLHAVHKRFGLMDPAAERLWLSNKSNKVYLIKTIHGIA